MNYTETAEVLAVIQVYDNRRVDETTVKAWHRVLHRLGYHDCLAAVEAHYTDSTDWLMPAHITRRVKSTRRRRLELAGSPVIHPLDEFDENGEPAPDREAKQKQLTALIANGQVSPAQYEAYKAGRESLRGLARAAGELRG